MIVGVIDAKEKRGGDMAEVLFDDKDKSEADRLVTQFLVDLSVDEQREFLAFMQGFRFAKGLGEEKSNVLMRI
jgi:hypothetical protein